MALSKLERRKKIKSRIRRGMNGSADRPRMTVFRSNKQISVQLVDDLTGHTVISSSSLEKEIAVHKGINKTEQARLVGQRIAEKAKEKGIGSVIFDRNGYLYHGRVKSLADAARKSGLKF